MAKIQLVDRIGFLNVASSFEFEGGHLALSPNFVESKSRVDRYTNVDGFVYPPMVYKLKINPNTGKGRRIPRTERPKLLHQLPPSHDLSIDGTTDLIEVRKSLAGFVMHCFAFLFGTRLQFHDWWLDGRIPMQSTVNISPTKAQAENFVSKAIHTWNERLDDQSRRLASNILFMFSRAASPEWDWEHFLFEYIVFDASYKLAELVGDCHANSHAERFDAVIRQYGLKDNQDLIKGIVDLRNNLFHEALWDQGQPMTAQSSEAYFASHHLRRFNHRLISAILAGPSKYSASGWWFMDQFMFE